MAQKTRILVQSIGDVTVVTVQDSSVVDAQHVTELRESLFELIDRQHRTKLVLDLTKVQHLSSSALGVLIPLQAKYGKAKGSLVMVGVSESIMKLFKLMKLEKLFKFADSESQAVAQLGGARRT
jgi:anti-sigma B factor antagonist